MTEFIAFILASLGLTVWIVWPEESFWANIRHKMQKLLPAYFQTVPDCYVCSGFWIGTIFGLIWWPCTGKLFYIAGGFITSAVFWIFLNWPVMPDLPQQKQLHENAEKSMKNSRLEICMNCEHFNGTICDFHAGCKTSFLRFLEKPESKCPKNLF